MKTYLHKLISKWQLLQSCLVLLLTGALYGQQTTVQILAAPSQSVTTSTNFTSGVITAPDGVATYQLQITATTTQGRQIVSNANSRLGIDDINFDGRRSDRITLSAITVINFSANGGTLNASDIVNTHFETLQIINADTANDRGVVEVSGQGYTFGALPSPNLDLEALTGDGNIQSLELESNDGSQRSRRTTNRWGLRIITISVEVVIPAPSNELYVSELDGDDANPGTLAQPLRTIQRAVDMVVPGGTIFVGPGRYRETVTLGAEHSGTAGSPTTITALNPNDRPVIDGTDLVTTDWEQHDGNIYKTTLDIEDTEQVFYNNLPMMWARFPNMRFFQNWRQNRKWAHSNDGVFNEGTMISNTLTQLNFSLEGALLYVRRGVGDDCYSRRILSHNAGSNRLDWDYSNYFGNYVGTDGSLVRDRDGSDEYFIKGKLELLDVQQEWFYDTDTQTLYFHAPGGVVPVPGNTTYKLRDYGILGRDIDYVHIDGIDFHGTSIDIRNASYVEVRNADFMYFDESLFFPNRIESSERFGPPGSTIYPNNPIRIDGTNNTFERVLVAYGSLDPINMRGAGNHIINSVITENNRHSKLSADSGRMRNHIDFIKEGVEPRPSLYAYNTAFNNGGAGIRFSGVDVESTLPPIEVKYNHIFNLNITESDISGLSNGNGLSLVGTEVHHNWAHNIGGLGYRVDIAGRNMSYHHNVLWATRLGSSLEGTFMTSYNNTHIQPRHTMAFLRNQSPRFFGNEDPFYPLILEWPIYNNISRVFSDAIGGVERNREGLWTANTDHPARDNNGGASLHAQYFTPAYANFKLASQGNGLNINAMSSLFMCTTSAGLDLRPRPGSALVDAGANNTALGIGVDYEGAGPDIGAYELGGEYWYPGADWLPFGLPVPTTMAEANALARSFHNSGDWYSIALNTQFSQNPASCYSGPAVSSAVAPFAEVQQVLVAPLVYPNPSTGIYTIDLGAIPPGETPSTYEVHKLLTYRDVTSGNFTGKSTTVNISGNPVGLYVISLIVNGKSYTTKVAIE